MMKAEEKFLAGYDKYVRAVYRHIFFRVSNQALAEDLTQETFFKAWRSIANGGGEIKNFRAFFYKIANNLIIDYYRRKAQSALSLEDVKEEEFAVSAPQEKEAARVADKNLIVKYLARLGSEYRQIIFYRYVDELSIKEISEITGKSRGNVAVVLHRGIKMLKEYVKNFKD